MAEESSTPKMKYRLLGRSGLKVSELSFGSWVSFGPQVDIERATDLMEECLKAGINFFDNAEAYEKGKAEEIMGASVKKLIEERGYDRSDFVLTTKLFFGTRDSPNAKGLSRKHIVEGTIASLKRMQLDYVDVLLCHRPDPLTPIEETVRAMNHVIDRGLAFYWGTSEWSAAQLQEAFAVADRLGLVGPLCEQCQYNLLVRDYMEKEYTELFKQRGLGTTIWSPLASGVLTGKYSGGNVPEGSRLALQGYEWLREMKLTQKRNEVDLVDNLRPIAEELGCTLAQLSIAWCLRNKSTSTVILGATSVKQLRENLQSLDVVPKLTDDILARIDEVMGNRPGLTSREGMVHRLRNLD